MTRPIIEVKTSTVPQKTVMNSSIDTTRGIDSVVITAAPVVYDVTGISIAAGKRLYVNPETEGVRNVYILNRTSNSFRIQVDPDDRYPNATGKVYVEWGEFS